MFQSKVSRILLILNMTCCLRDRKFSVADCRLCDSFGLFWLGHPCWQNSSGSQPVDEPLQISVTWVLSKLLDISIHLLVSFVFPHAKFGCFYGVKVIKLLDLDVLLLVCWNLAYNHQMICFTRLQNLALRWLPNCNQPKQLRVRWVMQLQDVSCIMVEANDGWCIISNNILVGIAIRNLTCCNHSILMCIQKE